MEQPTEKNEQTADEKIAELTDLLKRTQANFENYRKQTEKRVEEIHFLSAKRMILEILPILDNFELAFKSLNPRSEKSDFINGMELIYAQFLQILDKHKVTSIQTQNQKFDPYLHEALIKVEHESSEGTILEEFQHGYMLAGQVIRHAKVKISAGKKQNNNTNTEEK